MSRRPGDGGKTRARLIPAMVRQRLEGFAVPDVHLARSVCRRVDEVGRLNDQVVGELVVAM